MTLVLVTGATGTCGSSTIDSLLDAGVNVRAGVRDPGAARSKELAARGAEPVAFDFTKPDTLGPAFSGVDGAFIVTPVVENALPLLQAGVDAAKEQGVSFLLRLSAAGADPESEAKLPRHHGEGERIVASSGLGWAALRPTFFMDNFVTFHADSIRSAGAFYGASHGGRTAHISSRDIGAVAATILANPDEHRGKAYDLTGPEALTDTEAAEIIGQARGQDVQYVDLDEEAFAKGVRDLGTPDWMVDALVFLEGIKAAGWAEAVSPAVRELTGNEPETFASFMNRHANSLRAE